MVSAAEGATAADLEAVYGYLCREWNGDGAERRSALARAVFGDDVATALSSHDGPVREGERRGGGDGREAKRLVRFKAWMLRSPLDDPSDVSKRLLHEQWCPTPTEEREPTAPSPMDQGL